MKREKTRSCISTKSKGGKRFEPGNPGGPGRPPLPEVLRNSKRLTTEEFITAMHELTQMPFEKVEAIAQDKLQTTRTLIMANWLVESASQDKSRQSLFDRLFGKVKETIEVTTPKPTIITRPNGEQVILGSELSKGDDDEVV